ncbi:MAG: APC family permease [Gordonia sp. (in: high G+C Gram-positive bacteria)]|uniref:APC family permease n=1 Tax=Gordonia sp. (in: high G+C Gram-positive bacteria) TaxID=84139 RepID=UPI0039E61663
MNAPDRPPVVTTTDKGSDLVDKGLAQGKVGTLAGAVLGVSCVAPGYTLTASIGVIVAAVGLKMPAVFIAGFIPMFLTAYAYRELNSRAPDCGASFTWSTKAFGPYVGWMCGWGMVLATIIVLSNLAAIAVEFFYLFISQVVGSESIADLVGNKAVNIATTLVFIALAAWIAGRGITTSQKVQYALVGFQMVVLLTFAISAIVTASTSQFHIAFSWDWFNPFTGLTLSAFVIGLTGSIFAFWGWDTCLTLGEEAKNPEKTPGRSGLLAVITILLTYLLVGVAVLMYAGVGDQSIGLGNPDNAENVFEPLATPVLGDVGGLLLFLAIFASSVASLQTTFLPAARTMLAMGAYGAFPKKLASVHPRYLVPTYATVVAAIVTGVFYVVVKLISDNALWDTIASLGIMICWYYGITAFACVWFFRRELFRSVHNIVYKFAFPLIGGTILAVVFVISVIESLDPETSGSGTSLAGMGLVFVIGFGLLVVGAVLMLLWRVRHPAFFRGETLSRGTPPLSDDVRTPAS